MTKTTRTTTILALLILCLCSTALRQAQGIAAAGALPDTGQTKCYNDTAEIPCSAPGEDFHGQDARI